MLILGVPQLVYGYVSSFNYFSLPIIIRFILTPLQKFLIVNKYLKMVLP